MVDFGNIFNIVFVSVCAALLLLLLVSVIVVAVKGKRKCGVGDVLLRIVCSLVLIASAVMVACSVLTMLNTVDGSICIVAAQEGDVASAWLAMGGEIIELPLPELFVALSTVIGFGLSAVLLILSLTTLIVDCLVANKKDGKKGDGKKKKNPAVQKTPEQIKREKELERIRRIGESAVQKTSSVASAEKTEKSDVSAENKPEQPEQTRAQEKTEEQNDFDWRTAPAPEQEHEQTGFVGIKDEEPDSFDSFDSFDDEPTQESQESADIDYSEGVTDYATEETEELGEERVYSDAEQDPDQAAEESEEIYYDDDEQFTLDDNAQAYDEQEEYSEEDELAQSDEYEQSEQAYDNDELIAEQEEQEQGAEEVYDEQASEESTEEEMPEDRTDDGARESADVEPDRGIYIPKIRTVTPQQKPEVKTASAKAADKKPTAKKPTSQRPAKPKKSGGGEQKPTVSTNIPPEKKLPVTRRYVILDRHNAVNMFGEYLKERNQAEKDKLKSSINTIIIE